MKSKVIQGFDNRVTWPVTYAIYHTLFMANHTKSQTCLCITKLETKHVILGYFLVKKYQLLSDIENDFITFFSRFCTFLEVFYLLYFQSQY